MPAQDAPPGDGRRILIHNPVSGDGRHTGLVHALADDYGYEVRDTESAEDIVDKATAAAREADVVAAAGGDGTLTRAVRGLDRADAFDDTLFGVVPAGTGNNFAGNVGVADVRSAFDVIESGERRRIDVGTVDGKPFLNSVVAGLTAEASAETDPDEKERWGVLAYVLATVRTASTFDGLHLTVRPADGEPWECDAELVLIGNGRRFPRPGGSQANVEDGRLDVTVVEKASALGMVSESLRHAVGRGGAEHVREFTTPRIHVDIAGAQDRISVDGEIDAAEELTIAVRERTLWLPVGEGYEPRPDAGEERREAP